MKELKNLRKPREKHFLNENGLITAYMYNEDVHYLKNQEYHEIDNSLIEKENYFQNKENSFQAHFFKNSENKIFEIIKDENFLSFSLNNSNHSIITTNKYAITYQNILKNIDITYQFIHNKIKDTILLKDKDNDFQKLKFIIRTNLELKMENNEIFLFEQGKFIYKIEAPILLDKNKNSYPVHYVLVKNEQEYLLSFYVDESLLQESELYPFILDPTIVNDDKKNVYDTYIYPGDENADRNNQEFLKVGVDENNVTYRTLLKFDLPTIGTGCDVLKATAVLISHPSEFVSSIATYSHKTFEAHQVTSSWNEETANWNAMHDKYNSHIEDYFWAFKTEHNLEEDKFYLKDTTIDITNVAKKWYAGEENNGVLLKLEDEVYDEDSMYAFYSKNNTVSDEMENVDDPKPYLLVTYRNFDGLEDYMTYQNIPFQEGTGYVNNLTGNLTTVFRVNGTIGGKFPIELSLIYNANDVVLNNNIGLGKGYRWNFQQTLEEVEISGVSYLEYIDSDGTIHYFSKIDETTYQDEDGLNFTITLDSEKYVLKDKENHQKIFEKSGNLYYLKKIVDTYQNEVVISYDENHRINEVKDANNESIYITYEENKITTTSSYETSILNIQNEKIINLVTKFGTTSFTYDSKDLLSKITDINLLETDFVYYETSPYRMKKIIEKGTDGTTGNTLEFLYSFLTTKTVNQKGQVKNYLFNSQGNTINVTSLKDDLDFKNGYGTEDVYDANDNTKNKLSLRIPIMKYVKNLFLDPSFEKRNEGFIYDIATIDTLNARSGEKCVRTNYETDIPLPSVLESGYYTFSGYFKHTSGMELTIRTSNTSVSETKYYTFTDEYKRYFLTAYLEANTSYHVTVFPMNNSTVYMDDFQFESGEVVNYLNLIENSDFSDGMAGWTNSVYTLNGETTTNDDEIITLENGQTVYQMNCKSTLSKTLTKQLQLTGKKGDTYRLSFWYKNEGLKDGSIAVGNIAFLLFGYTSEVPHGVPTYSLNPHATEWQYFEKIIVAEEDYTSVTLNIMAQFNVNKLYFTNLYLVKDFSATSFDYDDEGNLISSTDLAHSTSTFQYNANNQLVSNFAPKGNNFHFEYDNQDSQKLLQGVSTKGIANQLKYDSNQNPIQTIIKSVNSSLSLTEEYFYIRKKATDKYLVADFYSNRPILKAFECNLSRFQLELEHDEEQNKDYYYIKTDFISKYFAYRENISEKIAFVDTKEQASLFELIENKNGSYTLRIKRVVSTDPEDITQDSCITFDEEDNLIIEVYHMDDPSQELFFESAETPLYVETKAEYEETGKFVSKTIDSLEKVTLYDIDELTGLTNSITNPKGQTIYYEYNDKEQVTKIKKNEKEILYAYNTQNLLSKITSNNKEYTFDYDGFLNKKQTKINNQILSTNQYEENNGNLTSVNYGNGNTISYTYDDFNRLKTYTKNGSVYTYYYDNMNNLSRITSNEETYEYSYDLAGRISSYLYNQKEYFSGQTTIDYEYDSNGNVTKKRLSNGLAIEYTYDEDDNIIKVDVNNATLNYQRDYLGRLVGKNINNQIPIEYTYYTNGNKTSFVLKSMKIENELYEYFYDDTYNLSKIFKNQKLYQEYTYDDFNELIEEHHYERGRTYRYTYDDSGNILFKREYELNTFNLYHEDKFSYENENWEDQLTKFNDIEITYDAIGNPTSIGDATLTWANGRELQSYQNGDLQVSYKYNKDGIRRKKIINNVETEYFTENNSILFETTSGVMLYYLRDDNNSLLGFIYNGTTYYYKKNLQDDIVGIYTSNYELIATYEYDAWGKILSIKDQNNNEIIDETHIAMINPFRYRSYYYDKETKLYYLNSRYYNPEWGRFINADGIIGVQNTKIGYNLFLYVLNRPILLVDNGGNFWNPIDVGKKIWGGIMKFGAYIGGIITDAKIAGKGFAKSFDEYYKKKLDFDDKENLSNQIKHSSQFQNAVKNAIVESNCDYFKVNSTLNYTNATGDLKLFIGEANVSMEGTRINNIWVVDARVYDTYDFTEWRYDFSFGSIANNFGLILSDIGLVKPYKWDVNFRAVYKIK